MKKCQITVEQHKPLMKTDLNEMKREIFQIINLSLCTKQLKWQH
jgi:hypothetical protein